MISCGHHAAVRYAIPQVCSYQFDITTPLILMQLRDDLLVFSLFTAFSIVQAARCLQSKGFSYRAPSPRRVHASGIRNSLLPEWSLLQAITSGVDRSAAANSTFAGLLRFCGIR